jgi:ElaB/YqjD/DUF883 family membrane-anchored ribosome-binding protein
MTDAEINRIAEYYSHVPHWRDPNAPEPTVAERVQTWVGDRPVASLATAVLMGVALGWLLKRR